jgi:hypothetical protein
VRRNRAGSDVADGDVKALRDGVVGEELSDGLLGDLLWVRACLLD